jgi:type IV secretory pathway TrbF-like protein
MRFAQLARALDQSTLKNFLSGGLNVVLAIGLVTIALRGGVQPIFIPYDQFGRVIATEDLARYKDPPRAFIDAALEEWLVNVRRIYHGNRAAQLDQARKADALLSGEAQQWLRDYYSDPTRNPSVLQQDLGRTVELVSTSKDPNQNVWRFQWREIEISARGAKTESDWMGSVEVTFPDPAEKRRAWTSEGAVKANPTGLRIVRIEWNRLRQVVSPAPSAVPPATPTPAAALNPQQQAVPRAP